MLEYIDPREHYQEPRGRLSSQERNYLRDLAKQLKEYAMRPCEQEKIRLWKNHNALKRERPMVLCFPEYCYNEFLPWDSMKINDPFFRSYEWCIRRLCFRAEFLPDDFVISSTLEVPLVAQITPFVKDTHTLIHFSMEDTGESIQNVPTLVEESDITRLHVPELLVDHQATQRNYEAIREIFDGILEVELHGYLVPDTSLLRQFVEMRGAEQLLYDLYDRPEWVHQVLDFMLESTLSLMNQMEKLLTVANTGNDYVGSGGIALTDELKNKDPLQPITYRNCWGFSDAQELSAVSPEMFREFATAYHKPLLERFGLSSYACCECLNGKFDFLKEMIPNLRRVSVSPWTDREGAAEKLENRYIYSWKANPAQVSHGIDPEYSQKDIQRTRELAKDCVLEMILKDNNTVEGDPTRLIKWVEIAMKEAQKGY